jgi:hypothetical protein
MKVAVKDACVLIDLVNGGLLDIWFQLGIETHTTDLVLRQVRADRQGQAVEAFVKAGLLIIDTLTGEQVLQMMREFGHLPVGIEDQSVLFLAMKLDAILITGDRRLRLESLRKNLEVRGMLWILDELVEHRHLAPKLAAEKLRILLLNGAFLPPEECDKRFRNWSSTQ